MSGKPQFDEKEALQGLIDTFTELGYHGTSLSDIEKRTGLNRSSLYNSFGSKSALFMSALEEYVEQSELGHFKLLENEDLVAAFTGLFESQLAVLKNAKEKNTSVGCLTTCAIGQMPYLDKDVEAAVKKAVKRVKYLIEKRLKQAISQGQLPKDTNTEELRDFLFGAMCSIALLYRNSANGSESRNFAKHAIERLSAVVAE